MSTFRPTRDLLVGGVFVLLVATGCGGRDPFPPPCSNFTSYPIGIDEESPLGYSAAEAMNNLTGTFETELLYTKSQTSCNLTLEVAYTGGDIEFVGGTDRVGFPCGQAFIIPLSVHFETDDGMFDVSWGETTGMTDGSLSFALEHLDRYSLNGEFEVPDGSTLSIHGAVGLEGSSGKLIMHYPPASQGGAVSAQISGRVGEWPPGEADEDK